MMCFIPNCFINLLSQQLICGNQFAHKFAHFCIYKVDFFWAHHIVLTIVINAGIMPPHKKRNIVSTQRSAFWPCGSCRQNYKSGSVCCDACRRWHHASCEGLNAAEFKFFNESDAPYTCNDFLASRYT